MLTELAIRQAVEFQSQHHPVLSIYLNVDPHRRSAEKYKLALRALLDKAEKADPEDRRRIQNYIEMGYNWQGRGIVIFSCAAEGFWWAESLPVPVEDSVFVSFRPYVHQLATLLDAYARLGVIHVDQIGARLYLFHLGHLEAAEGFLGEEVRMHRPAAGQPNAISATRPKQPVKICRMPPNWPKNSIVNPTPGG